MLDFPAWVSLVAFCISQCSVFTFNFDPRAARATRMCFLCLWRLFPPTPPPLSLWAWKNSLQVSHRFFTEFRCQMKGVTVMRLPWLPPFRCVYIHFRPLPPPHTAIHNHVVLCAFRAYQQEVRRKVNSNSFVYLPGSPTEGRPRSLEEGSGKETLGSDFRRSLWNSQS